jgi:putative photosynthetic complex assembly protein 2
MIALGLPILAALALWWGSTGLIMLIESDDRKSLLTGLGGATLLLAVALWLASVSATETSLLAAYLALACGLVVWGWQLVAYYAGVLTGPNKRPCAPGSSPWSRFRQAVGASLYHELACASGAIVLFALVCNQPNQLAFWTYAILWIMHTSAKLNLFFGMPNFGEDMLPRRLAFLTSFMARRPMNPLFPISVSAGTAAATAFFLRAASGEARAFEVAGSAMLGALMSLAVLEHWFLVAPFDAGALWSLFRRPLDASARVERELEGVSSLRSAGAEATRAAFSWRADPQAICDQREIERVLKAIADGRFGEVDVVRGLVRTKADWVCFELTGGRALVAAFAPRRLRAPVIVAKGREFDRAGLKAAFDDCAALA